ncbi:MAG: hypothetical protein JW969_07925 [Spirochaetales bacterium]|nr:hypothetical protein [Spirochaetales bacterium]
MKNTAALTALSHLGQAENTIVIHPNDGFDLGLLTLRKNIKIYSHITVKEFKEKGGTPTEGLLVLENQCKLGTIELNPSFWRKLGKPKNLQLFFKEDGLLLLTAD